MISCCDGSGFFNNNPTVFIIIPGVQYPHCNASCSIKAFCTGCRLPSRDSPSMVTIFLLAASLTGNMQDLTASFSRRTVHAPQKPRPQPYLVPVNPNLLRKTHNKVRFGSSRVSVFLPFSSKRIVSSILFEFDLLHSNILQ